jgi:hypothetical protein
MRHKKALAWIASSLYLFSTQTQAWGPVGHELVGSIAEQLLAGTPTADKVHKIIGMDLAQATVWADCAKGVNPVNGEFVYYSSPRFKECRPFESDEGKARMVDYVRRNWDACHPTASEEACHKQYHYADVAIQQPKYAAGLAGTSDHDIVSAINAAILVLQGKPAPAPFSIVDQREAILMLAHYLGDIHEPMHIGSVYLDADGHEINPKHDQLDPATGTKGGNDIDYHGPSLHYVWDDVSKDIDPLHPDPAWLAEAKAVKPSAGNVLTWSAQWADDSLLQAKKAFDGVSFSHVTVHSHAWSASYPDNYADMKTSIQHEQLVKAGARLAQLLAATVK